MSTIPQTIFLKFEMAFRAWSFWSMLEPVIQHDSSQLYVHAHQCIIFIKLCVNVVALLFFFGVILLRQKNNGMRLQQVCHISCWKRNLVTGDAENV